MSQKLTRRDFGKAAAGANRLNASIAQQLDGVEQGLTTPVHRVVARHRYDVESAIDEYRRHRRRQPAVAAA